MDLLGEPPSNFATISGIFILSYIFLFRDTFFPKGPTRFYEVTRRCLTTLLILHTLYTLRLLLSPPINLFSLLELPLTAPVQAIRVALLRHQQDRFPVGFKNHLLPHVETLLNRLASFEARVTYIKYGPYPLAQCEPCVYPSDFIAFTVAPTVLPYLRALLLVSLLTSAPTYRTAWRTPALFVLAASFFTEVWWTFDTRVQFKTDKVDGWTYTHTHLARYAILLLLPLLIHVVPAHSWPTAIPPFIHIPRPVLPHQSSDFNLGGKPGPSTPKRTRRPSTGSSPQANNVRVETQVPTTPYSTLNGTITSLSTTLGALHVLEWARLAGLRRRELREQISDYFSTADGNAIYARSDPDMMQEAEKLGMGYSIPSKAKGKQKELEKEHQNDSITRPSSNDSTQMNGNYDAYRNLDENDDDDSDEEDDLTQSPLRVKAREKAKEITRVYLQRSPGGRRQPPGSSS